MKVTAKGRGERGGGAEAETRGVGRPARAQEWSPKLPEGHLIADKNIEKQAEDLCARSLEITVLAEEVEDNSEKLDEATGLLLKRRGKLFEMAALR